MFRPLGAVFALFYGSKLLPLTLVAAATLPTASVAATWWQARRMRLIYPRRLRLFSRRVFLLTSLLRLLGVVIVRALRIATRADDLFGLLVASGIAMWFAFQSFVNIGMTIGIMPITGLPLPFVSYGGSAVFADMIAIGLLQSIHRRRTVFELSRTTHGVG